MKLYNQILMEHYHNPKHYGKLENPDFEVIVFNPLCGDKIYLYSNLDGSEISELYLKGEGCIISLATASILFDKVINQTIEAIEMLSEKDILDLIKLEIGPNRLKCALLPLEALKTLVEKYKFKLYLNNMLDKQEILRKLNDLIPNVIVNTNTELGILRDCLKWFTNNSDKLFELFKIGEVSFLDQIDKTHSINLYEDNYKILGGRWIRFTLISIAGI